MRARQTEFTIWQSLRRERGMKEMKGVWRIAYKPRIGVDVVNRWCLPCGRRLQVQSEDN